MLNPSQCFRFVQVEEFFSNYKDWDVLNNVVSYDVDESRKIVSLGFEKNDGKKCVVLLQFPRKDTFRFRFNPGKEKEEDYTLYNTRSIIMDTFHDLKEAMEEFTLDVEEQRAVSKVLKIITIDSNKVPVMKILVQYAPFSLSVFKFVDGQEICVMSTADMGIHYIHNGCDDYSIIQSVKKPATAKYVGFGEHGGVNLDKNTTQLTYFNFDNMRYRQVYNRGPIENREPLYHSDPFFIEFFGVPNEESAYGIFIDNPSQICMDIGYINSQKYMFGTRFGDLDYYFFLGSNCVDVMDSFTSIVGKAKLKPRYSLGYHQGCYGYDKRQKVEEAANNYRKYQIPIDGIHIDVDIQKNYKTFTIDQDRFPDPQGMFTELRNMGFKCSTNITPIISNQDANNSGNYEQPDYQTYKTGIEKGYFVEDTRFDVDNPDAKLYQDCDPGQGNHLYPMYDPENNFNSGKPYIGEVYYGTDKYGTNLGTTGHYPDFGRQEVRYWWGEQYKYLFNMGLEMVWQDMTTPCIRNTRGDMRSFPARLMLTDDFSKAYNPSEDDSDCKKTPVIKIWNLFSYNLHKATYYGLGHLPGRENKRNFIIGRGCFTGMHRYAGLWTGDNASEWDFLKINVSEVLALGLTGQAMSGQDIGGFESATDWEKWADPELLIRWTAMGAFLPWFRNHYTAKGSKEFQEPYAYQGVDLNTIPEEARYLYPCVLPICKYYIELRYRLLQLFYDAMFENTLNGLPISRAMFINDCDKALFNDKLQFIDNQFFVRKDLLVAPVLEKQANENNWGRRDVYLPAGSDWYLFMDNVRSLQSAIEGGTTINYDAHIDADPEHLGFIVPMYVRAGAIIPTIEIEQYVGERNSKGMPNPITLNIYPGAEGQYTMYLDDGISRSSAPTGDAQYGADPAAKGEYREINITHNYTGENQRLIKIERVYDNYTPMEKFFYVAILQDASEQAGVNSIKVAGKDIPLVSGDTSEAKANALSNSNGNAWYFNQDVNINFIKIFDASPSFSIELGLGTTR